MTAIEKELMRVLMNSIWIFLNFYGFLIALVAVNGFQCWIASLNAWQLWKPHSYAEFLVYDWTNCIFVAYRSKALLWLWVYLQHSFTKMNLYIITKYTTHYLDTEFNSRILSLWSMSAALISPTADILITQHSTSFSTRDIRMLAMDSFNEFDN